MYLNKYYDKKSKRTYLSIVKGYRDDNGKSKHVTVQKLGVLEELKNKYKNPIEHFNKVISKMNEEENRKKNPIVIKIYENEKISDKLGNRKNFGYVVVSKVYHELEIDKFCAMQLEHTEMSFQKINSIVRLLVYSRIVLGHSKYNMQQNIESFFDISKVSIKEINYFVTRFDGKIKELKKYICNHVNKQYNVENKPIYYFITNYYFAADGVNKDPTVQCGLFTNYYRIPIHFDLFQNNGKDCINIDDTFKDMKEKCKATKIIVVAEQALYTSENIGRILSRGDGYVMNQNIKGTNYQLQKFVLENTGYIYKNKNYKIKSRICPKKVVLTSVNGAKIQYNIDEKQVVSWSKDYDKRDKKQRQNLIDKAKEFIKNPKDFNKQTCQEFEKYIKNIQFNEYTKEVVINESEELYIDYELIKEEEKYDGYYSIVTSECTKSNMEIIDIYRGLWRISDTFKLTRSEVMEYEKLTEYRSNFIKTHFTICYLTIAILRIVQHRLYLEGNRYSAEQIVESLSKCNCSYIKENYWMFNYTSDALKDIGKTFGINFDKRFMQLSEIRGMISKTKKLTNT